MDFIKKAADKVSEVTAPVTDTVKKGADLSTERIAEGLSEALDAAAHSSVETLSAAGGFTKSDKHIDLPKNEFGTVLGKVRSLPGIGGKVDELDLTMNQAAELAVKAALTILVTAVKALTFQDAKGILQGGDTAATDYFDRTTHAPLSAQFLPIVSEKLSELGVMKLFEGIVAAYDAIPLHKAPAFNFPEYVTENCIGALFKTIGSREKDIRQNPALQTTSCLQEVFGSKK